MARPGNYRVKVLLLSYSFFPAMYFKKSQLTIRILSLLLILNINFSYGQSDPRPQLLKLTAASDSFYSKQSFEKLYLQCDKSSYVVDDTLWFKAYLVNSAYLTPSKNSGVMYLDIANDSNKVVKTIPASCFFSGISWGNIHLNEKEFKPGGLHP